MQTRSLGLEEPAGEDESEGGGVGVAGVCNARPTIAQTFWTGMQWHDQTELIEITHHKRGHTVPSQLTDIRRNSQYFLRQASVEVHNAQFSMGGICLRGNEIETKSNEAVIGHGKRNIISKRLKL